LEGKPPLLAVGDHPQADALLEPDGVFHGSVFDGLESGTRDPACGGLFPRRNELGGAKQAADVVCVASDHGARSKPRPLSLLWTANALETVSGFKAVALLVVRFLPWCLRPIVNGNRKTRIRASDSEVKQVVEPSTIIHERMHLEVFRRRA
jgi:hypothetical protein